MSKRLLVLIPLCLSVAAAVAAPASSRAATGAGWLWRAGTHTASASAPGIFGGRHRGRGLIGAGHPARVGAAASSAATLAATTAVTPCTWSGSVQFKFADTHAHYWVISLGADPNLELTITGTYPAARYASVQAYNSSGSLLAGLADKDFPPDPGSINPFATPAAPGARRGAGTYILHVVFGPVPTQPLSGTLYANLPAGAPVTLIYRVFQPDWTAGPSGNVPLPAVTAQSSVDGTPVNCPQKPIAGTAASTAPAAPLPSRKAAAPMAASAPPIFWRVSAQELGGYGNEDIAYLFTKLPPTPATSPLYVVRFTAPTTPRTAFGQPLDLTAQLRYWSFCTYFQTEQSNSCLVDGSAAPDSAGKVTIVLGPWWAWPSNATTANHVVWISLNWFTSPYFVLLRHLMPAPTFAQSAFAVPVNTAALPAGPMGPYAPTVVQCSTQQFEANRCGS